MFRCLLILLGLFTISVTISAQTKKYKLISKTEKADFNYVALNLIDDTRTREARREAFNPISGNYTVFIFVAKFEGHSFTEENRIFNDILIVKIDTNQKIIDAYQYTLEWAEPPYSYDLYRLGESGLVLMDQLSIDKMKFRRVDDYNNTNRDLSESGTLAL